MLKFMKHQIIRQDIMRVIEKFVSINGEGVKSGELSVFIRFEGCNLRCSYCDTTYSFINPIYEDLEVLDIVDYILSTKIKNVTLTGGEPLLQKDIYKLLEELSKYDLEVEIETNGSISIKDFNFNNVSFTLDYKTPSSKMEKFMNLDNYKYLKRKDTIKFVCGSIDDLKTSKSIMDKYNLYDKCNLIISPIFNSLPLESYVSFMISNNMNNVRFGLQIHKIIWDKDKRGV